MVWTVSLDSVYWVWSQCTKCGGLKWCLSRRVQGFSFGNNCWAPVVWGGQTEVWEVLVWVFFNWKFWSLCLLQGQVCLLNSALINILPPWGLLAPFFCFLFLLPSCLSLLMSFVPLLQSGAQHELLRRSHIGTTATQKKKTYKEREKKREEQKVSELNVKIAKTKPGEMNTPWFTKSRLTAGL